jgi:poly-gamma-glutamate capsule biosynthesis protein CapA/YwtB (metallophosphatase superfamily)
MGDLVFSELDQFNRDAFRNFLPQLAAADLVFGNLEGAITENKASTKRYVPGRSYAFRFPPATARLMKDAHFHAVNVANNHSNDFGQLGFDDTHRQLAAVGIETTGEKGSYIIREIKGLRVGLIGFAHYPRFNNILDIAESQRLIADVRAKTDLVIVTHQGGAEGDSAVLLRDGTEEFLGENRGDVRAFAKAAIAAGASLVVGHGPHVLRAAECIDGKPVLHSIGNFVSVGGLSIRSLANVTVMMEALFDAAGGFKAVRVIPVTFADNRLPEIDDSGRGVLLINFLGERASSLPKFQALRFPGYEARQQEFESWLTATGALR